jgi:hypothetical protein
MDDPAGLPDPDLLVRIARELATELYTLDQILIRYDIDKAYFDQAIGPNKFYQQVYNAYLQEWQSISSTHKRLAFAAAAALEDKLPTLANRMGDRNSGLGDAVATAKLFRDLAGIATPGPNQGAAAGDKFSISINFGHHKVALETKVVAPIEETMALEAPGRSSRPTILLESSPDDGGLSVETRSDREETPIQVETQPNRKVQDRKKTKVSK